jgi:hypothetical protein
MVVRSVSLYRRAVPIPWRPASTTSVTSREFPEQPGATQVRPHSLTPLTSGEKDPSPVGHSARDKVPEPSRHSRLARQVSFLLRWFDGRVLKTSLF